MPLLTCKMGYSTIHGEGTHRGITVGAYPRKASLNLYRFIITNGKTPAFNGDNGYGAGIFVWDGGTLVLVNSIVSKNSAAFGGRNPCQTEHRTGDLR